LDPNVCIHSCWLALAKRASFLQFSSTAELTTTYQARARPGTRWGGRSIKNELTRTSCCLRTSPPPGCTCTRPVCGGSSCQKPRKPNLMRM
jgi:hypothetical protein